MKKLLILAFALIFVLSSCASESNTNSGDTTNPGETTDSQEIRYGSIEASWLRWESPRELVESEYIDIVLIGRVSDISFQVVDMRTGLTPMPDTKEKYDAEYGFDVEAWRIYSLRTVYDLDVITTYKGEGDKVTQIRMSGGIKDFCVEEQLSLLKEYGIEHIVVLEDAPEIKIGDTYLFVLHILHAREGLLPTPMNMNQCIYNLRNPFEKNLINKYYISGDPESYYSKSADDYGNPIFSAMDVISVFGEDKWDAFWTQWQKDNPDWETRLNKAEVEKALAAR